MEPMFYTINQVWERIGRENTTRATIYKAVQRGDFPSIRIGRKILIRRDAFEQFLLGTQPLKKQVTSASAL
jgi:excisionase family DNA binding protein